MGCHCEVASLQTKAMYMKLCDFAQTAIGNWISWESFCYLHLPWPTYTFQFNLFMFLFLSFLLLKALWSQDIRISLKYF